MLSVTQGKIRPRWDNPLSVDPEVLFGPCLSHGHGLDGVSGQRRGTELRELTVNPCAFGLVLYGPGIVMTRMVTVGLLSGRGGRFNQVSAGSLSRKHMD